MTQVLVFRSPCRHNSKNKDQGEPFHSPTVYNWILARF
jgi:hypothetical protein